ncbi:MAG: DUF805 domain-containing protein [Candidatus Competibacteraceae bacterium]
MSDISPYQAPRSAITPTAPTDYGEVKILSTAGRLGRVRYIGYSMGLGLLANIVAGLLGGVTALFKGDLGALLLAGVVIILMVLALVMSIMLVVQRLHDFDANGWWAVLMLVPLANIVLYLVLLIMPGTQGANRFGNPPPPNTTGVIILALIVPAIAVIGIIAAIAIPAYHDYTLRAHRVQGIQQQR